MEKMWAGRFHKSLDCRADDFNSSIRFDSRMYKQDIKGSVAHATMLASRGIIAASDAEKIIDGLGSVLDDIEQGKLQIDPTAEDIHMFVEAELTKRIGDVGKRLHTARSRNDQVAVDIRLYLRDEAAEITDGLKSLLASVLEKAKENTETIVPGYTHLQRAQPITFAHHLLAYCMMFMRDVDRIGDAVKRMNVCPLGSCALAGTTYDTDREAVASALGFDGITENSIDGVSAMKPKAAFYIFPKIDSKKYNIKNDEQMVYDFLVSKKILLVQGSAFNYPTPDHVRIVYLPTVKQLNKACEEFEDFLKHYKQK